MSESQILIDVERCLSESYSEMVARHKDEFKFFPVMCAVSKSQFDTGMRNLGLKPTDTDKILCVCRNCFIRKADEKAFEMMNLRQHLETEVAQHADLTGEGFLLQMFRYELAEADYGYTRDAGPALKTLHTTMESIRCDERMLHAFEMACQQEVDWYNKQQRE